MAARGTGRNWDMTLPDLTMTTENLLDTLQEKFGQDVKTEVPLAPFTAARIGGPADILVTVRTSEQLATCVTQLWQEGIKPVVLGGGSNVLIGDKGIRGVTVINRAKAVRIHEGDSPYVWTESGTVLSNLANRCALRGLSGLEWAGTVPGTVGGAVYWQRGRVRWRHGGLTRMGRFGDGFRPGALDSHRHGLRLSYQRPQAT